jgi:hypothetical protein
MGFAVAAAGCKGSNGSAPDAVLLADSMTDAADDAVVPPTEITIRTFSDGFPYTGRTENAALVALQEGDGGWLALTGTDGVYHATVTHAKYGVVVGCHRGVFANVTLYYQSVSDTKEVHADGCVSDVDHVHVTVSVTGVGDRDPISVWIGGTLVKRQTTAPLELDVPKGITDVFVSDRVQSGDPLVYRGPTLDLQADQMLQYDLSVLGQHAESHPVTIVGLDPGESVAINSQYSTPHSRVPRLLDAVPFPTGDDTYLTVAAATRQPADVSAITALAARNSADDVFVMRGVQASFLTVDAKTLTLPPPWIAQAPILLDAATSRATLAFPATKPVQGTVDYVVTLSTATSAEITQRMLEVLVRPGWIGNRSEVTITTPDLSHVSGWTADMGLAAGAPVSWTMQRADSNMPYNTPHVDGRLVLRNFIDGQIAPAVTSR